MYLKPALQERQPLISIGMPVYNCGPFIEAAVASLQAQTYPHWELLLVDDGSQDDTLKRVQRLHDPRIRLFADGRNQGLPTRLNQTIDAARGTLFARMDGDDIAYPERFARQVAFLKAHPEVDVVSTHLLVFRSDGTVSGGETLRGDRHEDIVRRPWAGFHFNHATWMGHLGWFQHFRYRPDVQRTEDDDLMLRAYRHSRFARLPDILYGYRVDELRLDKILKARYHYCKVLLRETRAQRDLRLALGVFEQAAKAAVDTLAIGTGLHYHLLHHRARPVSPEVVQQWEAVSAQVEQHRVGSALPVVPETL
jgi:glycosyltransferase involved in cell wall biosynthesis